MKITWKCKILKLYNGGIVLLAIFCHELFDINYFFFENMKKLDFDGRLSFEKKIFCDILII